MDRLRPLIRAFCSADFHFCQNRHRKRQFQPGYRRAHRRRAAHGLGHRLRHGQTAAAGGHQRPQLALSHTERHHDGPLLAVLLLRPAARRGQQGRARRQIQRRYHHVPRLFHFGRRPDLENRPRRPADHGGNAGAGILSRH